MEDSSMNQISKKTASDGGAKKKQEAQADPDVETNTESDAEKLAKAIAESDARKRADPGAKLMNELWTYRCTQEADILTQETMPVEQTRVTMRLMYARI